MTITNDAPQPSQRGSGEAIQLAQLSKHYDDQVAVDGIDLEIGSGEFFSLLGPSGCGKTTTLRMIVHVDLGDGVLVQALITNDGERTIPARGDEISLWCPPDAVRTLAS